MSTVVCQCVPLLSPSPTRRGEILFSWAGRLYGKILLALIVKIEVWTISNKLITAQCTFCVQWLHTFISNCFLTFREHFLGLNSRSMEMPELANVQDQVVLFLLRCNMVFVKIIGALLSSQLFICHEKLTVSKKSTIGCWIVAAANWVMFEVFKCWREGK